MVIIFTSSLLRRDRVEYKVVVLPLPVGPEMKIMPYGLPIPFRSRDILACVKPSLSRSVSALLRSRIRSTTFSP
ncbi:hypothetical protein D3C75_1097990 [compost metagenome]